MKKVLLISLLLASSAWAGTAKTADTLLASEAAPSSNFERLQGMFYSGSLPALPSVTTAYTGRCFSRTQNDAVKGAAYIIIPQEGGSGGDNGPLDPGPAFIAASIWKDVLSSYDAMTLGEILAIRPAFAPLEQGYDVLKLITGNSGSFLRQSGLYLVEQIANTDGSSPSYYCYYYRTVQ